jgi:hypothetical protein
MELDIHSAEESGLYDQRAALRGMIHRAVPALGHRQAGILREASDEAYPARADLRRRHDILEPPAAHLS